jgi:hypothetical protein
LQKGGYFQGLKIRQFGNSACKSLPARFPCEKVVATIRPSNAQSPFQNSTNAPRWVLALVMFGTTALDERAFALPAAGTFRPATACGG